MGDFYREKKPYKKKKDYKLHIMVAAIILTVVIVMTFIFIGVPLLMANWWHWLTGASQLPQAVLRI